MLQMIIENLLLSANPHGCEAAEPSSFSTVILFFVQCINWPKSKRISLFGMFIMITLIINHTFDARAASISPKNRKNWITKYSTEYIKLDTYQLVTWVGNLSEQCLHPLLKIQPEPVMIKTFFNQKLWLNQNNNKQKTTKTRHLFLFLVIYFSRPDYNILIK